MENRTELEKLRESTFNELMTAYGELFDIPIYRIFKYYEARGTVIGLRRTLKYLNKKINEDWLINCLIKP